LPTTYWNQGERKKNAAAQCFLQDSLDQEVGLRNTILAWPLAVFVVLGWENLKGKNETDSSALPSTLCTLTTVVHPDTIQSFSLFAVQIRGLFPVMLQENQQQNNIKSYSFREFFVGHKKRKRISSYIVLGRRGRWRKRSRNQGQLQTCDL
jgi:hypothetical protein